MVVTVVSRVVPLGERMTASLCACQEKINAIHSVGKCVPTIDQDVSKYTERLSGWWRASKQWNSYGYVFGTGEIIGFRGYLSS